MHHLSLYDIDFQIKGLFFSKKPIWKCRTLWKSIDIYEKIRKIDAKSLEIGMQSSLFSLPHCEPKQRELRSSKWEFVNSHIDSLIIGVEMKIDARLFLIIVLHVNDFGHTYTREDVMATQRRQYETKSNLNLFALGFYLKYLIYFQWGLVLILLTMHQMEKKNAWTTPRCLFSGYIWISNFKRVKLLFYNSTCYNCHDFGGMRNVINTWINIDQNFLCY